LLEMSAGVQQLKIEQLIEGQSLPADLHFREPLRAVQRPKRGLKIGQRERLTDAGGERIGVTSFGQQLVEIVSQELPDLPLWESLGGGIDGEDLPGATTACLARAGQHHMLARLDLPSVEESHGAADQQEISLTEGTVEEWLAGPRAFNETGAVAEHRLEDAQPLPGGQHPLGDDPSDHGRLHAWLERADRLHRG